MTTRRELFKRLLAVPAVAAGAVLGAGGPLKATGCTIKDLRGIRKKLQALEVKPLSRFYVVHAHPEYMGNILAMGFVQGSDGTWYHPDDEVAS